MQEAIIDAISTLDGTKLYKNRHEFTKLLSEDIQKSGINVKTPFEGYPYRIVRKG